MTKPSIAFFYFIVMRLTAFAQVPLLDTTQVMQRMPTLIDTLGIKDSLARRPEYRPMVDSLGKALATTSPKELADSLANTTLAATVRGDIETTIDYKAKDSIFFDMIHHKMYLYGDAKIDYGAVQLEAQEISLDWVETLLQASYVLDSADKKQGKPIFKEAGQTYETDKITYNFKSKKALIDGVVTQKEGGFMHGDKVKKNEKDEMFVRGARYTTCNHANPHFYIQSTKMKVIPGKKVISGPFNLYFGDIPTPIGFPFGMFPEPKKKSSGIIFPSYGEDQNRGFFLQGGGYYFDINEYIDFKLTGGIFSKGSYELQAVSTYKKRYKFSGNVNMRYNHTVSTQFESGAFSRDFWVNWSHSPLSTGTSRFSASVSAGTSSYSANSNDVATNFRQSVNTQFNSNVSYSKTFKGTPFNLAVNARHSQNIATKVISVTLPDLSFNMNRIYPFKRIKKLKKGVLGKLGFSYNLVARNEMTNTGLSRPGFKVVNMGKEASQIIGFNTANLPLLFDRAKIGAKHTIPINTSFNVGKYLTVTPSFNYNEVWYPKSLKYTYDATQQGVRIDTLRRFSRAGWYSTGASVSTRFYGMYGFKKGPIKAIRHVITPSIGFSYSPDFSEPARGTYQRVQTNPQGTTRLLSKFQGFAYGGPSSGKSGSMSFSLGNNIEMKVKSKKDTVTGTKKIKLFDNLSISSGYNFLADSFKLSNFNWNARTSLFNNAVSLSLSGNIDPYVYILDSIKNDRVYQRRIDKYAWDNGQGIGRLTQGNVAIGFNLQPKAKKNKQNRSNQNNNAPNRNLNPLNNPNGQPNNQTPLAGSVNQFISNDPNQYVPFDVPWNLNVNYSLNYTKNGFRKSQIIQTLNFSGNVSITQKTKIGFNSGYDIKRKAFTVTRLNVSRDLHCWTITFNWVPFGARQSYFVEIRVNSQLLKDLKLDKRSLSNFTSF